MEPEKEKESEKEKKKRKPAAKSKDSRGLSVVLYRNCKARFYSETCFQETTSSFESTACNIKSIYSQSSSVKQWLNEFCPEFEDNCLLNVKDDEGLVHKLSNFQAMASSTRTSTMNPIDVSSIEEIKALKIEKMSQASIFEKCYGFDFDFYLNAGGPIYSSSFAPSNGIVNSDQHTSGSSYDKFLAVGLSRVGWPAQSTSTLDGSAGVRADSRRVLGERDKSDNLLQIWHLSGSVHFERQPVTYKLFQKGIVAGNHGKNIGRPKGSKNKKGVIADKKKETTENTQRKKKGIIESDDEENEGSDDAEGEDASRVNSSKKQKHASADSAELEPIDIVVVPASCSSSSKATAGAAASGSTSASLEPQSGFEVKLNNVQALFDEYFQEVKRDLDNEETAASPAVAAPNLVFAYGVHLESRGPVWQMAWCPVLLSSGAASAAADDDTSTSADALGVLAVVCGDGSCLVLVLPRLTHLSSSSTDSTDLDEVPVLAETSVCRVEISQPGDMVSSLCWNPHKPFELMCGMMSGVIGIYSLTPYLTSTLDGDGVATVQLTMPDACLCDPEVDTATPCYGAITTLQMCPYRDNWLLSGGCDGNLKVWDLHRPFLPLLVKEGRNTVSQVAWDPCGMGLYSADLSSTSISWERWTETAEKVGKGTLYGHAYKYGGIWGMKCFLSDKQSFLVSVASDGTVRGAFASAVGYMKHNALDATVDLFRVLSVDSDASEVSEDSDGSSSAVVASVTREKFGCEPTPLDAFVPVNNRAMHALDATVLMHDHAVDSRQSGCYHVLAYGGAAGLLRVHSINPLKMTFRCPKGK